MPRKSSLQVEDCRAVPALDLSSSIISGCGGLDLLRRFDSAFSLKIQHPRNPPDTIINATDQGLKQPSGGLLLLPREPCLGTPDGALHHRGGGVVLPEASADLFPKLEALKARRRVARHPKPLIPHGVPIPRAQQRRLHRSRGVVEGGKGLVSDLRGGDPSLEDHGSPQGLSAGKLQGHGSNPRTLAPRLNMDCPGGMIQRQLLPARTPRLELPQSSLQRRRGTFVREHGLPDTVALQASLQHPKGDQVVTFQRCPLIYRRRHGPHVGLDHGS